ncbi:hypothetical protein KSC_072960 [Ktedonobacter sp. SOSP1-52]|uniref:methyltransferase family protein n=1 Tax=Ktedonobacter sp. SOSP1-52 TaxID=2778366 RepID=UPI0019157699|nr:isoprenylcysteine carboxylmethyltransferase family protein [Ktedonobacter sp. SOSP1-52]GHO68404.1 hypothetical protein KSC_072960 [Ktedonobacter sp. SOSP1-52]
MWRAHTDLGHNWSPTVEISHEQVLVTQGIYQVIRHPIYAALWLMGIAQVLLLQNWVAGLSGLIASSLVQFLRVPQEEQMMLDQFGDAYREYMQWTGGIFPKL